MFPYLFEDDVIHGRPLKRHPNLGVSQLKKERGNKLSD